VITLQNTLPSTCNAEVLLHRGPGQTVDDGLLVNGEALANPLNLTLEALAAERLRITAPSGLFQGAARVTDNCRGLSVTAGYDIVPLSTATTQNPPEIFSYAPQLFPGELRPGIIGRAVVDIDPQGVDGLPNNPGLAIVADPDLPVPSGYELCQRVTGPPGTLQTDIVCNAFSGTHQPQNLLDVFPDIPALNDATWEFFLTGPSALGVRADVLVIDVTSPNQFRGVPVTLYNQACGPEGLCLGNNRFKVEFEAFSDSGRVAVQPQQIDPTSGLFFFTDMADTELLVKVLDGCAVNNRFWVFAAATTDVQYWLTVTDTLSGETMRYLNPLGTPAPAITDTQAFATCP
jgi:hypothetical protein